VGTLTTSPVFKAKELLKLKRDIRFDPSLHHRSNARRVAQRSIKILKDYQRGLMSAVAINSAYGLELFFKRHVSRRYFKPALRAAGMVNFARDTLWTHKPNGQPFQTARKSLILLVHPA